MDNFLLNGNAQRRQTSKNRKPRKGITSSCPTAPSNNYKFKTSVTPNPERKGFNCQAKRFRDVQGARIAIYKVPQFPAANAYSLPSGLISKCDFSNTYSSMFQLPFCAKVPKLPTPAPNQYNASLSYCKQQNNVCARAVFLSKTQRGFKAGADCSPAPGSYKINESLVTESPKTLKSIFQSRTSREFKVASIGPGPAAYCPNGPLQAPRKAPGLRKHRLNFSAPALALPPQPPPPGPGQYEIVDFSGPPKQDISSAVFVSGTSRWAGPPGQGSVTGPGPLRKSSPDLWDPRACWSRMGTLGPLSRAPGPGGSHHPGDQGWGPLSTPGQRRSGCRRQTRPRKCPNLPARSPDRPRFPRPPGTLY
ncbi:O(6)-methylguanine-induced apoptosis 2 isoform X2 [Tachyglossus aculeatus]|uniref:O(6)-methylguanine-induced apoptosis 2 isoform X2 n=1 Tax=Tachyglossus aculeatus TaxID=9261 RepID=UPI0018F5DA06|nr:O(6)-methylguanine-induced apoptosis 2 isoform X2 [Tachyglossus aculeatus]